MGRPLGSIKSAPNYRHHKPSGQAVVTVGGQDVYLGLYGTPASRAEYDRVVGEWLATGRQGRASAGRTIAEVVDAFWAHAKSYYLEPDGGTGREADNYRCALRPLLKLYSATLAGDFGPLALKSVRDGMVKMKWCRSVINRQIGRIKHVFKWATANELVPASIYQGLSTLAGLRAGRSEAVEAKPVRPVPEPFIVATLPHLCDELQAVVNLQLLTGMRPGEACIMRGADLNTAAAVWIYRPSHHKTEHHGIDREIRIGPKAQDVIRPFLRAELAGFLFSPAAAEEKRHAQQREDRQTPMTPSQSARKPAKDRQRPPANRYTVASYRQAIARACDEAFPPPAPLAKLGHETHKQWQARLTKEQHGELKAWRKDRRWHPHQLRHNAGTRFRRDFGLDAARILLGHTSGAVTTIYAEQDLRKADEIMAQVG